MRLVSLMQTRGFVLPALVFLQVLGSLMFSGKHKSHLYRKLELLDIFYRNTWYLFAVLV